MDYSNVRSLTSNEYPKIKGKTFSYGTAGFRTKAEDLRTVMFRMGVLAVLRSKATKASIGLMITASHNPACDNGVKLVDPEGEMMQQSWETFATLLANAEDSGIVDAIKAVVADAEVDESVQGKVVVGRDSRPSSKELHDAAVAGIESMNGVVTECGIVTTPLLHYRVLTANDGAKYGPPNNKGYTDKLVNSFLSLQEGSGPEGSRYTDTVTFDGANGVGAFQMETMRQALSPSLKVNIFNDAKQGGVLNEKCGADFVKTSQGWPEKVPREPNTKLVSVDGDADRIMYAFLDAEKVFHMCDGDKIATLVAGYLQKLVKKAEISVKLGLVQTAYANGASTRYINGTLGVPVACAKTGVKFLHHEALQFDIGVYFEANGHGTVLFSDNAKKLIKEAVDAGKAAARRLLKLIDVINETVGDAISDMFLVEVILKERGWSMQDWDSQYKDLPNKLVKIRVKDRSVITTTDAERKCVTPTALQPAIDALVNGEFAGKLARSFIRPSGTEDVVRVYAECQTKELAELLALKVSQLVFDNAGGVGTRP